ncbi:HVO_A0114 family putative DNA-binding protein [Halarchaeum nitratireducens]|uniref:Transcriptional regulator n=1 Tax=Halarchaeum nitratireducens TaxID=489913 RepID=A0A830GDR6_9EURY|nr:MULTISPECIES: transcriptional regulator [Halarchaeum]MBP2252635.1 putative transcriptional regulator [Halarchaeum solikamskense]GGN23617.1 transcriptional regulator [Halarchaeum nitratireducens]
MNDNTHSDDPEADAENYPSTLRITVGGMDDVFDRAIDQAGSEGVADEAVRTFESVAEIRKLLTDRRLAVMRAIMTETPDSISDLADRLDRNYADVHADVQVLANQHIVYFEQDGRAKRPIIPYERIHLDIEVVGEPGSERAHA